MNLLDLSENATLTHVCYTYCFATKMEATLRNPPYMSNVSMHMRTHAHAHINSANKCSHFRNAKAIIIMEVAMEGHLSITGCK